jgi:hypothetical protein
MTGSREKVAAILVVACAVECGEKDYEGWKESAMMAEWCGLIYARAIRVLLKRLLYLRLHIHPHHAMTGGIFGYKQHCLIRLYSIQSCHNACIGAEFSEDAQLALQDAAGIPPLPPPPNVIYHTRDHWDAGFLLGNGQS